MTPQAVAAGQWTERRRRAADLRGRWPFAREVLTFYSALLDAQERVYDAARSELSDPSRTIAYTVARALPLVSEVTASRRPERLARAVADLAAAEGTGPPRLGRRRCNGGSTAACCPRSTATWLGRPQDRCSRRSARCLNSCVAGPGAHDTVLGAAACPRSASSPRRARPSSLPVAFWSARGAPGGGRIRA